MIAFQTFLQKIQKGIKEHYGTDYDVEIHEVKKNNAVTHYGITVMRRNGNVAPTIYMEQFYQEYMDGCPLSEVLRKVIRVHEKYKITEEVDLQHFLDFERAKKHIAYKLVHYGENAEELKQVPHIRFLDMAVVFYYKISHTPFGNASILIRRNLCGMWKISEKELYKRAKENTPHMLPPVIRDMQDVLSEMETAGKGMDTEAGTLKEKGFMYVLSNPCRQFGAACILYPDVLNKFAESTGKNLYLLPSSVHEVLLVPEQAGMCAEAFEQIVREINSTQIEREEILSDSVYYYDWKKKELMIAHKVCR